MGNPEERILEKEFTNFKIAFPEFYDYYLLKYK